MLKKYLLAPLAALLLLAAPRRAHAQTGAVGIGTTAPNASAALDVSSTSKGLLPPRMDKSQRDAIASPAAGLTIYNTTTNKLNTWNGTRWDEAISATEQPTGPTGTFTFAYTGAPQTFTVPAGVTSIKLDARGAQGGSSDNSGYLQYGAAYALPYSGGAGARVQATLAVVPGQVLTLYVGGAGSTPPFSSGGSGGGYNGGGNGSGDNGNPGASGGGGGGASDVRTGSATLADRLLVAAGGGGGGLDNYLRGDGAAGGAGGAPTGGNGRAHYNNYANGATLTSGNALGQGQNAYSGYNGAGGGGGYYGGRFGLPGEGGGGGGSSYVTATSGSAVTMTAGYQAGNGSIALTLNPTYAAPALDGSNIVNVPGTFDNLGDHTATQNLNLGPHQLVGNGGTTGLSISSTGGATLAGGATIGGNAAVVGNSTVGGNSTVNGTAAISGNVGIGVSGLANRLAVVSTGPAAQLLLRNPNGGTGTTAALDFQTYTPVAATDPSGASIRAIDDNSSAALSFLTKIPGASANALVERLRIAPAGNVGIGTTAAPSQKLEVAGQIYSSTGGIRFPDNTVQTSAGLTAGSAILNQTTLQAGASFNIGGTARVAGQVGIGTTSPAASAALDVSSTTQGLLPPRLSPAQRDAIASPAAGLTIYNTTSGQLNTWNGTSWTEALSATENGQLAGQTFSFTGGEQLYTVPAGVTSVQVDARGAQGGNNTYRTPPSGGANGGRVVATLSVTPGEVLRVYVGGTAGNGTTTQQGGYNGGGTGAVGNYFGQPYSDVQGGGGGGASDVRRGGSALANRVVVAGGGGGAGFFGGGGGGDLTGGNAPPAPAGITGTLSGTGGSQTAGGSQSAILGQGGSAANVGGGGGGGYYGGGAGGYMGGGGGSSYTDPAATGVAHTQGFQSGNGQVIITALRTALLAPVLSGANIVGVPGTWSTNGTDVYRTSGNVGIGTSTPGQSLDVVGNTRVTGTATVVGTHAVAGTSTVIGSAGIGTTTPAASAVLDVSSTTKGLLPPRMTTIQRDAIAAPAAGLTVYNTVTNKLNTWNGTSWDAALSATEQRTTHPAQTYTTPGQYTYTVPAGVTSLTVDAAGAQGGPAQSGTPGAPGGRVEATLTVVPGEVLTLYVGGVGSPAPVVGGGGGYNGGGAGGYFSGTRSGGGGGATDVRRSATTPSTAFADRLLAAAGGGGSGNHGVGGAGGGLSGTSGTATGNVGATPGSGGTQSGGGGGYGSGVLGQGGNSAAYYGGGGGAGYYGGGAGNNGGGGGGSSYVTPTGSSGVQMTSGYRSGDGLLVLTPGPGVAAAPVLDGSNFVNVPGDNLGNHTATQNLNLGPNALVGNGGSTGLTIASTGNVGLGTTTAAPATQRLDVRGNVRLGTDGNGVGTGNAIEWVGPGVSSDPVGLYRVNPASDQSELRVVVGDTPDANDKFVVGRSSASTEGGIPAGTFTPNFTVNAAGNVGIGVADPQAGLHIDRPESANSASGVFIGGGSTGNPSIELRGDGKTPYLDFVENAGRDYSIRLISQSGTLALLWGNTGTKPTNLFSVDGGIRATAFNTTSDARFKTHVRPIGSALASVLALRGVRYDWNALGVRHGGRAGAPQVGLLAQEVEKIYPELVSTDAGGYKAVNYAQLTPVLIEALKEQQQQIEALKTQNSVLKAEATATTEAFEARLRRLEAAGGQAQR